MMTAKKNLPKPMAAQQSTVTTDNVTFKLVMEWAVRGFRSQHRVNKYNNRPNNDRIKSAAGAEPRIPKLYEKKNPKKVEKMHLKRSFHCIYSQIRNNKGNQMRVKNGRAKKNAF